MPMGTKQQNDIMRATIDVWEDKVFLNEKEYPAGHFATEILNVSPEFIRSVADKTIDLMALLPDIPGADKDKLSEIFPKLQRITTGIIEDLSVMEPFSLWDIKEEQVLALSIFSVESLDDLIDRPLVRKFLDAYLSAMIGFLLQSIILRKRL